MLQNSFRKASFDEERRHNTRRETLVVEKWVFRIHTFHAEIVFRVMAMRGIIKNRPEHWRFQSNGERPRKISEIVLNSCRSPNTPPYSGESNDHCSSEEHDCPGLEKAEKIHKLKKRGNLNKGRLSLVRSVFFPFKHSRILFAHLRR